MSPKPLDIGVELTGAVEKVWVVKTTVDEYGRTGELIGIFTSEAKAKEGAQGKGWYGGEGDVRERRGIRIWGDHIILLDISEAALPVNIDLPGVVKREKEAALAKLSDREKSLLGLDKR